MSTAEPSITIHHLDRDPVAGRRTEFVERKGVGHPDTICDGIAEAVSRRLSRYYRDEFGRILHHNTDKVQLVAGRSEPAFGGGEVVEPMYVLIGGRATTAIDSRQLPVNELAIEAARRYLDRALGELTAEDVDLEARIGETSADLRALFAEGGVPLANDTSVGAGYAPLSETDRIVRDLEPELRERIAAIGEDIKVMAWRTDDQLRLTVAAAVISRHVADIDAYVAVTEEVATVARRFAEARTERSVEVAVNAADDVAAGTVYLTETGLSAEMGDDGNVGRGNRVNGVITPHRPMSLEASAGKNPASHVGKLYNLVATNVADRIHRELGAEHASVKLLSRIGTPITEPLAVDVDTTHRDEAGIGRIVGEELTAERFRTLTDGLVAGEVDLF